MKCPAFHLRLDEHLRQWPPWYYGYAYRSDFSLSIDFYLIPFHYVMRFWLLWCEGWARFTWGVWRSRDKDEQKSYRARLERDAYFEGYEDGKLQYRRRFFSDEA